jgi:hypothetical protein
VRPAALLLVALLVGGCSETRITTVDAAVVEISPGSTAVQVNGTSQLSATVRSSNGNVLSGRTLTWRSLNEDVAHVDAEGNVQGVAPGTAVIEASVDGVAGRASVTVTSGPTIQLSAGAVEFAATAGGDNPAVQTVAITNAGDGALTGLDAAISYAADGAAWLSGQLSGTTAPATLSLRASAVGLAQGNYSATVRISAASAFNSPQQVVVTLTVQAAPIPDAPTNVVATALSPAEIRVGWQHVGLLVTSFEVERASAVNPDQFDAIGSVGALSRSYTDAGLIAGTSYSYRVRACGLAGCSGWSPTAAAVTPSAAPAVPQNLSANPLSSSEIFLSWTASAGAGAYDIRRRRVQGNNEWTVIATLPGSTTVYRDSNLDSGTRYFYEVRACAGTLCSAYSSTASAETL